jgi:hypothetical protein
MAELKQEWPAIFVFKVWGSEHMMAGLPDLLGCLQGSFFGLEVKLPASRMNVSQRQEYVGGLIRRAGGIWWVVTSPAEAIASLRQSIPTE